jgi:hypothetical protein
LGAAIGIYRPQYRPLSAIRYLNANPLPTRYTLFSTLSLAHTHKVLLPRFSGGSRWKMEFLKKKTIVKEKNPYVPLSFLSPKF